MRNTLRAYKNKISNKLFGVVHLPYQGKKKGDVLLSYMTGPFTQAPGEFFTDPHSNYWECTEIARLLTERGYAVDVISSKNTTFTPRKPYAACVDVMQNLERLHTQLPPTCKKILQITSSDPTFQNKAEQGRLVALHARRKITLSSRRTEPSTHNAHHADFLAGFGNKTVHATYAAYGKPIFPIPISVTTQFDFPTEKDFTKARTHFLWFGGGGAVLKGLDLILEAFAQLPEYTLHIIGPAAFEEEFARAYATELALPNIHRYPRPQLTKEGEMMVGDATFLSIANQCTTLIYPAASEGTSGAVIQAMHAGVIPFVTTETGIAEDAPVHIITPTIETIMNTARMVASTDPLKLEQQAKEVWQWVRTHHTKETFTAAYSTFLDDVVKL